MEDILNKINNVLSQKQIDTYEIIGTCNDNGEITEQLPFQAEYREDAAYFVSLVELSTTSFIPNLDQTNNKFYYSGADNTVQGLSLDTGAYDVKEYAEAVCKAVPKENGASPIEISLSGSTGKVTIKLLTGYKIYFDRANTWRDELGFGSVVLSQPENLSSHMASILKVQKVYVSCDIFKGSYFSGKQSTILYSFHNAKRFGVPLSFVPQKLQYRLLNKKSFNKIIIKFTDDNHKPVNFMGAKVTVLLQTKQI